MSKIQELFEVCKKHGVDMYFYAHMQQIDVKKFLKDAKEDFHLWYDKSVYFDLSGKTEDELIEELIRFIQEKENPEEKEEQ